MDFFIGFIEKLVKNGHTVDLACNCEKSVDDVYNQLNCKVYNIPFSRNPFSKSNLKAYSELKSLVEKEKYDIVHCHTPIAAMCTRLACISSRKKGTKVFYTAHGFHFYKGAPLKNWLMYYPIEKICSYFTDVLITINKEDYALAKRKMKAKRIEYVNGVGIDTKAFGFSSVSREEKRKELSIPADAKLLFSVGELNQNKNHETVIKAIKDMDVYYIIAGHGGRKEYLQALINELGISQRVKLIGYRTDIAELYSAADIFVHPSFREGLPVSVMEAMCSGLALVVADNRGNRDLCEDGTNGFICSPFKQEEFANSIKKLLDDENLRKRFGKQNIEKIKQFDVFNVITKMEQIYFN